MWMNFFIQTHCSVNPAFAGIPKWTEFREARPGVPEDI